MKRVLIFSLCGVLLTQSAGAGVIYLKNGDRITGEIKKIWDGDVIIEPSYADEFSVDQVDIAYMEADPERQFDVEKKDGTKLVGALAGADEDGNQLLIVNGQQVAIPMAELAELEEPEKAFDWEAHADLNSTFNSGNTNNNSITFSVDFLWKKNKHRNYFDLLWQDEDQDIDGERTKVKDRERFRYSYNYSVRDPWFIGGAASWERDPFKGLDYRYNVLPAAGYSFWDDAGRTLSLQAGVGYQAEQVFDDVGQTAEGDGTIASLIFNFRYKFARPDLDLYLKNQTTGAFYGRENVVTQFNTGARYEITDLLYLNLEFILDYETQPVEGVENEDISLLFGFGLEFEK